MPDGSYRTHVLGVHDNNLPPWMVGAGVFVLWVVFHQFQRLSAEGFTYPASLALMGQPWSTTWLVLHVMGYIFLAPMVEELAFRGYLRSQLTGDRRCWDVGHFTWLSFLLSSLLFGLFHQSHWLTAVVAGMAYALTLYRLGS